ncbi:MAG: NUDIX domain-containing protein [Caldilineaceae bacterium]|nr:NUDIX domain-containing protein [Caldilineaceae bacterium]
MKKVVLRLAYFLYSLWWRISRPFVVGVRLILIQDDQILLVRHTYQAHWYFPGGAVKRRETLLAATAREATEEAGARLLETPRLLGMYTNFYESKSDHIAVFVCNNFQIGQATDQWEIDACQWFPLAALPADLSPGCGRRLQELAAGPGPYVGKW